MHGIPYLSYRTGLVIFQKATKKPMEKISIYLFCEEHNEIVYLYNKAAGCCCCFLISPCILFYFYFVSPSIYRKRKYKIKSSGYPTPLLSEQGKAHAWESVLIQSSFRLFLYLDRSLRTGMSLCRSVLYHAENVA